MEMHNTPELPKCIVIEIKKKVANKKMRYLLKLAEDTSAPVMHDNCLHSISPENTSGLLVEMIRVNLMNSIYFLSY